MMKMQNINKTLKKVSWTEIAGFVFMLIGMIPGIAMFVHVVVGDPFVPSTKEVLFVMGSAGTFSGFGAVLLFRTPMVIVITVAGCAVFAFL